MKLINLGRLSYTKALHVQKHYEQLHLKALRDPEGAIQNPASNALLIVEHDPVYTIGIRTKDYTIKDEEKLKELGAEFYRTNRGGLITFHGPGQLVAYPIIHLKQFKIGMRKYIETLENVVIETCDMFGVKACTTEDTGVWVKQKKICAIGKKFVIAYASIVFTALGNRTGLF